MYVSIYVHIYEYIWMYLIGGMYTYSCETYEFVSWDDDIPNLCGKNVPNHQPDIDSLLSQSSGDGIHSRTHA